jgi:4-diphosphocytidyl-2-C-methyl-D-erythritol kinase
VPSHGSSPEITITGIELDQAPEENLVVKAWEVFREVKDIPTVKIHLHKNIPVGAGLGGGSSDATFMLKALNRLFDCQLTNEQLEDMAARLGSDCAFFIRNQVSLGTGRGEILKPVFLDLSNYEFILINPGIHIGTKEAYAGVQPGKPEVPLESLINKDISAWQEHIKNDFEASVFANYPAVAQLKKTLIEMGARYASMSGSGSSVYGIFTKGELDSIQPDFGRAFVYRGEFL